MAAKRKPLETVALADLGVPAGTAGGAGAGTWVQGVGVPPARPRAARVDRESEAAEAIVAFLTERHLV
jgi:electron transfer flavoprotein beta subunit